MNIVKIHKNRPGEVHLKTSQVAMMTVYKAVILFTKDEFHVYSIIMEFLIALIR